MRNPSFFIDDLLMREIFSLKQHAVLIKKQRFCSLRTLINTDNIALCHVLSPVPYFRIFFALFAIPSAFRP